MCVLNEVLYRPCLRAAVENSCSGLIYAKLCPQSVQSVVMGKAYTEDANSEALKPVTNIRCGIGALQAS